MRRVFNTTAACMPEYHYMVDLSQRLKEVKKMVDAGQYFAVNRARQYGKTTLLKALAQYLEADYTVASLDFQRIDSSAFMSGGRFTQAFARLLLQADEFQKIVIAEDIVKALRRLNEALPQDANMDELFWIIARWCKGSEKPIVLLIDEVDSASDNQVFLDFLSLLRSSYIDRKEIPAFHSVILAGVTDVKNLKRRLRPEDAHKFNSPWNIAADFKVSMSFDVDDIAGMLVEYEQDHHTGMEVKEAAQMIYEYTGGYPFLVSRICQLIDEKPERTGQSGKDRGLWKQEGISEAAGWILMEKNTLFESLMGKVHDLPELDQMLQRILFSGEMIPYNPDDAVIDEAEMYGFVKNANGFVKVANRIFEMRLYNFFMKSYEAQCASLCRAGTEGRSRFVKNGCLDMEGILEWYAASFHDIYGDRYEVFDEAEGRRRFLLFLKPIINGTGNYYIEAETRNHERMDMVIDYLGERFVIELKIWRGSAYHRRGERQLAGYLDSHHLDQGYLLSYNFNKNKNTGVRRIRIDDKELVEVVI